MDTIKIKPHHLLDILKLHGKGRDFFVPDEAYGHDFYRVANSIVNCDVEKIIFIIGCDDICEPCRFNKNGKCSDKVGKTDESKEEHNFIIDQKLFDILGIEKDKEFKFDDLLELLKEEINYTVYKRAWSNANDEEVDFRYKYGMIGLGKVIAKNTIMLSTNQ
jgi:hypothetical protein